jgi:hypothetical protein
MIELFLNQLQQPVCVIAHNGNRFDFPILKKQFQKFGSNILDRFLCCDSLQLFRKLESEKLKLEKYKMSEWKEIQESTSNDSLLAQSDLDSDEIVEEFIKSELEEIEKIEKLELEKAEMNKFAPFVYRTPSYAALKNSITNGTDKDSGEPSDLKKRQILNETTPGKGISMNKIQDIPQKLPSQENPRKVSFYQLRIISFNFSLSLRTQLHQNENYSPSKT